MRTETLFNKISSQLFARLFSRRHERSFLNNDRLRETAIFEQCTAKKYYLSIITGGHFAVYLVSCLVIRIENKGKQKSSLEKVSRAVSSFE